MLIDEPFGKDTYGTNTRILEAVYILKGLNYLTFTKISKNTKSLNCEK